MINAIRLFLILAVAAYLLWRSRGLLGRGLGSSRSGRILVVGAALAAFGFVVSAYLWEYAGDAGWSDQRQHLLKQFISGFAAATIVLGVLVGMKEGGRPPQ